MRRHHVAVLLAVVAVIGGVSYSRAPRPEVSRAAAERLADGAWLADSLVAAERQAAAPGARIPDAGARRAIALGYLERQRLGLGSPFRLIDLARQDPRLDSIARERLAWALLDRTLRQSGQGIEPLMLAEVVGADGDSTGARREAHLGFIQRTMTRSGDPRVGELALRLAYTLAAAERVLPARAPALVAPVLAMARGRVAAAGDARQLLWSARRGRRDALALLGEWRSARRFAAERPVSEATDRQLDARVAELVPPLLDSLRGLAVVAATADVAPPTAQHEPLLTLAAAARLSSVARLLPPLAPVVVAVRAQSSSMGDAARQTFVPLATNDESLAAEYARLRLRDVPGAGDEGAARAVLAAAVGLRALAQQPVWFPGSGPAVDPNAVADALGLRGIIFDRAIPNAWRPYYLASLDRAVGDLRRVLPELTLTGARVHFVRESPQPGALALHDPGSRTIVLPIATAGGTLAHELAHELDWQAARRLYARRGIYSTDRAVAEQHGRLAASLRGLSAARLVAPDARNGYRAPHDQRPAEVFARNVDWFVAVSLAREGRMNGDLTAVQDEVLTGYASVPPGEVGGRGAQALMTVLDDVAFVREPLRAWFLAAWGPERERGGLPLVRRVLALPLRYGGDARSRALTATLDPTSVVRLATPACAPRAADAPSARLAMLAIDARARAAVQSRVRWLRARGDDVHADALSGGAPWSADVADGAEDRVRAALLRELRSAQWAQSIFDADDCR